ncbi:LacI family DNA-binding transcriptional regulator [Oryzobacter sp. R7]|uniref:LacI family DNA-binding transcriptional regulator n=1 Tax=Oryzobacter faecalis TaxID=3388656 RepID=UPI00398D00CF
MTEQSRGRQQAATIYAVADLAQVSIATVSRVLQGSHLVTEKTREKVLDAVRALDYLPSGAARSLAARQHAAFGLVLPELSGPYYSELLVGFETRAAELHQSVMLVIAGTKDDHGRALRTLASQVDGVAVMGADVSHVRASSKPLVVIAGQGRPDTEVILTENVESARTLTEHLLDHGRSRLLFVGDPGAARDVHERHEGFLAAHAGRGLVPAAPVLAPFREREGAAVADRIISGELSTDALVCGNDELALSIMSRVLDAGLDVPGDLAVVGWDDVMTARYVRPGLTTVRQPVQEVGALAADRLHDLVSGAPSGALLHVLPTEVVIRSSCGCPAPSRTNTVSPAPPRKRDPR